MADLASSSLFLSLPKLTNLHGLNFLYSISTFCQMWNVQHQKLNILWFDAEFVSVVSCFIFANFASQLCLHVFLGLIATSSFFLLSFLMITFVFRGFALCPSGCLC